MDYLLDPHHQDLYVNVSSFLAVINNQTNNPRSEGERLVCVAKVPEYMNSPNKCTPSVGSAQINQFLCCLLVAQVIMKTA